ncbi:DUF4468 domain-containing protein [Acinetobacter piscicola]|uniref:DUF4468 domain-containing protein n=1 Tax=Acinetobacter piscicola TaxID=2006115 RepID=UPI00101F39FF|nr:DUF4468 domain-containing protein [Acinetobacter piscicola]RYL22178.1 DUF4468 domain-containing protein [Acinetobacter piscicola]
MKKLLLGGVLSFGLALSGCATTPQQPAEPVKFEKVYQIEGLNQSQIYDGARQWFATTFRSANAVIQYEDKTTGSIIGKGNMQYRCSGFADCMTVTTGDRVDFTVRVDTKDGRMRVSYDDLVHHRPSHISGNMRMPESNRAVTANYPSAKIIVDELNKSSDEMAEKIKTQQKVNADW